MTTTIQQIKKEQYEKLEKKTKALYYCYHSWFSQTPKEFNILIEEDKVKWFHIAMGKNKPTPEEEEEKQQVEEKRKQQEEKRKQKEEEKKKIEKVKEKIKKLSI